MSPKLTHVRALSHSQGLLGLIELNVLSPKHAKESGLTVEDGRLLGGALTYKDRKISEVRLRFRV